jgi:putative membrane protein
VSPPIVWTYEPSVFVGVFSISLAYALGWRRARRPGEPHPPGFGRLALFVGAMLSVVVALISPVDTLGTDMLVFHMIQHLLLLDVMPILLILSLTKGILRPVMRRMTEIEDRLGALGHPAFALLMYAGMMVLWHLPTMYDLALEHPLVHVLEHVCFAVAGTLYWWHLLSPIRPRLGLEGMAPVAYMVVTKLVVGMIGVALIFAPASFYSWYNVHPAYWGLSPHTDQALAGGVMALEQSIVMGIVLFYIFAKMLQDSERNAQRAERYEIV